jgi:anaerobic magnesium-protoporphyrin IX monomethyl ester cyclase
MKVVLIYPPLEPFFIKKTHVSYGLLPPLGLLYTAKILENKGDSVVVLDFSAEPFHEQRLLSVVSDADIVGITVLSTAVTEVKRIIDIIKHHHPETPIIIGGPHCTLAPENAVTETQADIGVQGDSELIIHDIQKALQKKKDFSDIPGVTYQTTQGVQQGPPAQLIKDIDDIPFPARHLVKQYVYGQEYNPSLKAGEFTSIITSRGCPFSCRFCSRGSISMQRYRMRSAENILLELEEIKHQGYHHVAFADDCFPANSKQAKVLFDAIIKEKLDLTFSVTATRVDCTDAELYKKMRQAGVTHVQFGLESGNQDVLDYYQKHTTVDAIRNAVSLSANTGFFTIGSFILGAPFETKDHFQRTLRFAKSLPLDSVSFLPLRYMIGSDIWNQALQEGKIKKTEYLILADKNRGLGHFTAEELSHECVMAQRSFYCRPSFFINLMKK